MMGLAVFALLLSYGQCGFLTQQLLMPSIPSGCYYRGSVYPFGWFSTRHCESCQCSTSGQVMCMFNDCWQPACADPVQEKDYCCPTCPNGKYQTYLHLHDRGALQELYSVWKYYFKLVAKILLFAFSFPKDLGQNIHLTYIQRIHVLSFTSV